MDQLGPAEDGVTLSGAVRHQSDAPSPAPSRRPPSPSGPSRRPPGAPEPPGGRPRPNLAGPPARWKSWVLGLGCLAAVIVFFHEDVKAPVSVNFTYTGFVNEVSANKVSTATISSSGAVSGKLVKGGEAYTSQIPVALDDTALTPLLLDHKVQVTGTNASTTSVLGLIEELLPFVLIFGALIWFFRRSRKQMGGGFGGIMGIGRSKAKVYDEEKPTTRFADIAGYEGSKAEVMEVVDFLKFPQRYAAAGAVGPKGVLMVGPPGTGKTLMARAVAGEAGVPFFALSGSSFVEMFVGVGASRVRDLFADARKRSPSIIFIDEIDAIGGRRRPGGSGLTTSASRRSTSCSRTWTASSPGPVWSSSPPPTGPRSSTPPCCGPGVSTGPWRSRSPTRSSARPYSAYTAGAKSWRATSTSTPSPGARPGSREPTSPTSSTRQPSMPCGPGGTFSRRQIRRGSRPPPDRPP